MVFECQVCNRDNLTEVLDLGMHPPSDAFLSEHNLKNETIAPLKILFCRDCLLVQLSHAVDPKLLFGEDYIYRSGYNKHLKNHFQLLAQKLINEFNLNENNFVVDIGANDGTLLEGYLPRKIKVLGVEPSSVAKTLEEKKIPFAKEFFNEQTAKNIVQKYGKANAITATNVFAHVKDLKGFMAGINILLDDKGIFLQESHYLLDMIKDLQYQEIYLEHLRYYSLSSLINLFNIFGLEVFDAERIDTHGGSIRTLVCKKGAFPIRDSIKIILAQEDAIKLNSIKTFDEFKNKVHRQKTYLNALLQKIKSENKSIVGLAAPAKGNTLLNFCKINSEILDYLVDTSEFKIGKFSPGMHIEIVNEAKMMRDQPDYILLLSWDIKDILIPKLKSKGYNGKFILPTSEII